MAGGDLAVAYHLNVHQQTVRRWVKSSSVPPKYWQPLAKMCGHRVTVRDIRKIHDNRADSK